MSARRSSITLARLLMPAIPALLLACGSPSGLPTVDIVRKIAPSVVRIQAGGSGPPRADRGVSGDGFGTGLIVDRRGHIVTSRHVLIAGDGEAIPDRILVTLWDRRTLPGRVVGLDRRTDLAVLKVEAPNLTPATFANASDVAVGQDVVAIGYALDLRGPPTVTRGIISALGRRIVEPNLVLPEAIQTDAGINPGNSGGPLVNSSGEVVGINSAVASRVPNIGFALSISIVLPSVESLIRDGRIERAYLGVATIDSTVPVKGGSAPGTGVPITLVTPQSPAGQAGLQPRDILLRVGGEELTAGGDLLGILAKHHPGDRIIVDFSRDGRKQRVTVVLGRLPLN